MLKEVAEELAQDLQILADFSRLLKEIAEELAQHLHI